jgi:hypothetical protein
VKQEDCHNKLFSKQFKLIFFTKSSIIWTCGGSRTEEVVFVYMKYNKFVTYLFLACTCKTFNKLCSNTTNVHITSTDSFRFFFKCSLVLGNEILIFTYLYSFFHTIIIQDILIK